MSQRKPSPLDVLRQYVAAGTLILVGAALRWIIERSVGRDLAFIYFLPFMVMATLRGGFGPGVLVCLGSNVLTFWKVDGGHWAIREPLRHMQPLVVSIAIDGMILWLCVRVRASQAAAERFAVERDAAARNTENILSSITGCFFSLDREYRFTYLNPEMIAYTRRDPAEMIGRTLWEMFPGLVGGEPARLVRHAMEQREVVEIETPGLVRPQQCYEAKLCPSPLGLSVYFRDVTERRRTAEAMEAQDALLRLIAQTAPVLIAYVDRELRYSFVNPRYAEWFGRPVEEIRGRRMVELWPAEAWEVIQPRVEAALAGESFEYEAEFHDACGKRHWMHAAYVPDRAPDGTVRGAVVAVVDESVRKQHEEEREALLASERFARAESDKANRIKDEFLATLSHELRTPLNAILGWAQLLRSESLNDPQDLAHGLETIDRNARLQAQIIEDLLDMSRIISGKLRLTVQPIDMSQLITSAVESVHPAAAAKGITIDRSVDVIPDAVKGDPARLQQVMWNLLNNAMKFTPRGGSVTVRARSDGAGATSTVIVEITDTGQGIKPEFLPYVFERFRQGDATTTRHHGGLGLGLSIVKQLVEMHGGSVFADSEGEGRGSTFTVTLPATEAQGRFGPTPGKASTPTNLGGLRVLVVDDEPDARELIKRMLEESDALVETASSALEGLQMLSLFCPDVLVSDIGMPGQDGYEFIRQVRAMGSVGDSIPAAALTAFAHSEDRTRALVAGYQVHVPKPVQSAELVATVARLAGRKSRGDGAV